MKSTDNQPESSLLKLAEIAPAVYRSLNELKRTGWVEKGVKNPETVKEHTESLLELATEISDQLTEEEKDGLLEMLEVHDWPEAIHGDEVILELKLDERKVLKEIKLENEKKALESICADLPNGEKIMALWLRFEYSDDLAAVFGRELDKYQAVEKALEYEQEQGIALFEEFLTYSINFIHHPVLLARIEALQAKWNNKT